MVPAPRIAPRFAQIRKTFLDSLQWQFDLNRRSKAGKGGLLIDPRAVQIKIDWEDRRSSRSRPRTFGTWGKEFIWTGGKFSLAEKKQQSDEYKILEIVWNSECWRHHDKLVNYMREKRNLEFDGNEAEFHRPELIKVIVAL
jgi:hypothetical protein